MTTPTTTPTLDTAIARLSDAMRALGDCPFAPSPDRITPDASNDTLQWAWKGLRDMAAEAGIHTGDHPRVLKAMMASNAAWCLSVARLKHVAEDPVRVEALAQMALRLLAWPEAMAVVEAAEQATFATAAEDEAGADAASSALISAASCDLCHVGARSFCVGGCENEAEREAALMGPGFERRKLVYAFDYDGTWSADPALSRQLVALIKAAGHTCICVTGRSDEGQWGAEVKRGIAGLMPIVFAAGAWKASAAERAGFKVDVWIDDMPEGIRELRADFAAVKREREAEVRDVRR